MPKIDYFVPVDADLQTIWRVLLDRIENPDRYTSGVDSYDFIESEDDYAVREIRIQGFPLRERITINEELGEVHYELMHHPLFKGKVVNALIPPAANDPKAKPVVQFRMDWEPLNEEAKSVDAETGDALLEGLKHGVHYVRDLAEHFQKEENKPD